MSSFYFGSLDTPIGLLRVCVSSRGVCDISFNAKDEASYRESMSRKVSMIVDDRACVSAALCELDAYFKGTLTRFTVPVDLVGVSRFTQRVLSVVSRIRYGKLVSYAEIASQIGSPSASRAVGAALGRNPVPIIVPCHRVITSDGRLGGFTGGIDVKRTLLRCEGNDFSAAEPTQKLAR